ncbi:hypothetical protein [Spirosoma litoris]
MHAGRKYTLKELVGLTWLGMPWVPIALLGTAAAFIAGFRLVPFGLLKEDDKK